MLKNVLKEAEEMEYTLNVGLKCYIEKKWDLILKHPTMR